MHFLGLEESEVSYHMKTKRLGLNKRAVDAKAEPEPACKPSILRQAPTHTSLLPMRASINARTTHPPQNTNYTQGGIVPVDILQERMTFQRVPKRRLSSLQRHAAPREIRLMAGSQGDAGEGGHPSTRCGRKCLLLQDDHNLLEGKVHEARNPKYTRVKHTTYTKHRRVSPLWLR